MKIMPVMANYAKHYASTIYQCLLPGLPIDFVGESWFSTFWVGAGGGGGGSGKRKSWPNSLIIEDLVVSHIS